MHTAGRRSAVLLGVNWVCGARGTNRRLDQTGQASDWQSREPRATPEPQTRQGPHWRVVKPRCTGTGDRNRLGLRKLLLQVSPVRRQFQYPGSQRARVARQREPRVSTPCPVCATQPPSSVSAGPPMTSRHLQARHTSSNQAAHSAFSAGTLGHVPSRPSRNKHTAGRVLPSPLGGRANCMSGSGVLMTGKCP